MMPPATVNVDLPKPIGSVRVIPAAGSAAEPGQQDQRDSQQDKAEALEAQMQAFKSATAALIQGAAKLNDLRREIIQETEEQLLQLAVGIASKVMMQEIQAERYEIEPIVKEALLHVPARQNVVIRLSPDDYAQCELARQGAKFGSEGRVQFIADPEIKRAQCFVETPEGIVESSPETHLANVAEVLRLPE